MNDNMELDRIHFDQNGRLLTAEDLLESMRTWPVTFDGLCEAYFEARRWSHAHEDLAGYSQKRLELLEELFEFELPREPGRYRRGSRDRGAVVRAGYNALASAAGLSSHTFWVYLVGGPEPMEATLRQKHDREIARQVARLRAAYLALFRDVLLALDPTLEEKTFTEAELVEKGLPIEKPDPDDYW